MIDRVHLVHCAAQHPAFDREVLHQPADAQQWLAHLLAQYSTQATLWPVSTVRSAGRDAGHCVDDDLQRGAKRQPAAGCIEPGTTPNIASRRVRLPTSLSMRVIERIRPCV